jgi:O-antigen/teichoic acid export membrane protein
MIQTQNSTNLNFKYRYCGLILEIFWVISRNFIKSSLMYTLAGALPMASAIILLPFYNLYLNVEVYGALSVYLTFSLLTQILVTYSFDLSVYVHYTEYRNNPAGYSIFVSSSFLFIAFLGISFLILSLIAGEWVFSKVFSNAPVQFFPYGLMAIVTALFQAFFKVYSGILQTRQQPIRFFWSNLLSFSLIAILSVGGLLIFPNTLIGPLGGRMIASIIAGGWALVQVGREFGIRFDYNVLRSTFSFNNGSYIYQVQQWVINNFDKILITSYLGLTYVGVYDFAFKCLMVIDFILSGVYNSILPKVLGMVADQKTKQSTPEINRYYHGMVAVTMILVSAAIICSPWIFQLGFIKPGYRDALRYVPLLSLVYLIKGIRYYFSFPYGALRYSKPLPIIYLIISIVKIGLMILLIPKFGLIAVIASAAVSGIIELMLLKAFINNRFHFAFNKFKMIIAPLLLGALIVTTEFLNLKGIYISIVYFFFCGSLLWWVYRKELRLIKFQNLLG